MIDSFFGFLGTLLSSPFNNFYSMLFFWCPMILNLITYFFICWDRFQDDKRAVSKHIEEKKKAEEAKKKNPSISVYVSPLYSSSFLSVGSIIKCVLLSIVPIVNCLSFIFDCMPEIFGRLSKRFSWICDIKFVKEPK